MICVTCRHWDKAAYPKNPKFGQCTVPLPAMPIWALRQISTSYRAIDMATKDCEAHVTEGAFKNTRIRELEAENAKLYEHIHDVHHCQHNLGSAPSDKADP